LLVEEKARVRSEQDLRPNTLRNQGTHLANTAGCTADDEEEEENASACDALGSWIPLNKLEPSMVELSENRLWLPHSPDSQPDGLDDGL
jgi:hypothetical protein